MASDLRKFLCVTADGAEEVAIRDVLVWDETVYLIVKGERPELYVFEIAHNGMRAAHPEQARLVRDLHEKEVEQWQTTE